MRDVITGQFTDGWSGVKLCQDCNEKFLATSGSRRFCDSCIVKRTLCPVCGGEKSIYDSFCGNTCAGKWKYGNSLAIREALAKGTYSRTAETFGKISSSQQGIPKLKLRGKGNPNWKGGTYGTERHKLMGRIEYSNWRKAVFERDNYTCVLCNKKGGNLIGDHIKPYYTNPELVFDVNNGRTLCQDCDKKQDTWGHKVKTRYKGR